MSERRGVSAAEKYAELLANGQESPRCVCHRETMCWSKNLSSIGGGRWRCAAEKRRSSRRYYEANAERERERVRRYTKANPEEKTARDAARVRVGGMHLGTIRFTQTEVEAMLSGTSD